MGRMTASRGVLDLCKSPTLTNQRVGHPPNRASFRETKGAAFSNFVRDLNEPWCGAQPRVKLALRGDVSLGSAARSALRSLSRHAGQRQPVAPTGIGA